MRAVVSAPHEYVANHLYDDYGLQPFFGCEARVKAGDGSQTGAFEYDGEEWGVRLYYQESGLQHPGPRLPSGTAFEPDTLREYRLKVWSKDDPVGQRDFNAHLSPRWQGMESKGDGADPTVPAGIEEAVNVRVTGSNIEFTEYGPLLRRGFEAVGVNGYYFRDPHGYSNVVDAARYVRLDKDLSGPVHGREGPVVGMAHLLQHDRTGYRKLVQNDTDEQGRDLPGYYHTVTLDPAHVREAFPHHDLPREVKHYYAREALSKPDDDPLAHPKLEVAYQVSRWDGTLGVDGEQLEQFTAEAEETILAVLADAGLSLRPADRGGGGGDGSDDDPAPFVRDAYFRAEEADQGRRLVELDLTTIRNEQESVVYKHLADGLSPVEWESLEVLVTDGGDVAPADIAAATGRHVDSVRRALRRIPELVETEYDGVALRSDHVAGLLYDAVREARDANRRVVETAAKTMEAAERGIDEATSAFIAFCARHGIDATDRSDARLRLRMNEVGNVEAAVAEAFRLWKESGRDPHRFRQAQLDLGERGKSPAWRWL